VNWDERLRENWLRLRGDMAPAWPTTKLITMPRNARLLQPQATSHKMEWCQKYGIETAKQIEAFIDRAERVKSWRRDLDAKAKASTTKPKAHIGIAPAVTRHRRSNSKPLPR
jgi:hypothetical protein